MNPLYVVKITPGLTVRHLILQGEVPLLVYATNDRGSRIVCFVFCYCGLFFCLICCICVWIILVGSVRVLVSLCSDGRAFWIKLRSAKFSPGLQHVEAGEGSC